MRKTLLTVIALIMSAVCAFGFAACELGNIGVEGKSEITADGKADSIALLKGFFDETIETANFTVTCTSGNETKYIEYVQGDKNHVDYKVGESNFYAFVKDGEYIVAVDSEYSKYIQKGKTEYDQFYCYFMTTFSTLELIPETGGTFTCKSVTEEQGTVNSESQDIKTTSTVTFEFVSENGTMTITADAKDGLVQKVTLRSENALSDEIIVTEFSFVYGGATVTVPDVSEWMEMPSYDPDENGEDDGENTEEENLDDEDLDTEDDETEE